MKSLRSYVAKAGMVLGVLMVAAPYSHAGIPVIDGTSNAQRMVEFVQTTAHYAKELAQMKQQYEQLVTTWQNMSGIRKMADIVNNPLLRSYLPDDYQEIMGEAGALGGELGKAVRDIRSAARVFDLDTAGMDQGSDVFRLWENSRTQNALDRVLGEKALARASARFKDIQQLLDKVNDAPDDKDIQDLQARIGAEQAMLANEQSKLSMLEYLAGTQQKIEAQQAREISAQAAADINVPRF
ncbi:P-type DNA transfer protein VirB5 [Achromobacter spanius]|uniref:P-type DNA transfer protein VirB5 n=1 Tax=Achromobacter spanius TaxID=217203 RepID=UPI003830AA07